MIDKLRQTIKKHHMVSAGDLVVVAVSGGPDSLALLHALWTLRSELAISLHVAHLDHRFRGQDSAKDALFVREFARNLGLEATVEGKDVPAILARRGGSAQEVAREVRYDFLRRLAARLDANRVALGHNRDDQAETVLLNLLRGAGTDGLAGIPPVREDLFIRPLLETTREEIEAYCRQHGLGPRLDQSNLRKVYLRNRIRHELIPILAARYNPNIIGALSTTAELAREDSLFLTGEARATYQRLAVREAGAVTLDRTAVAALAVALGRRVLREALAELRGDLRRLEFKHIESLLDLVTAGSTGQKLDLPGGLRATVEYGALRLERRAERNAQAGGTHPFEYPLPVPGKLDLPGGFSLEAELLPFPSQLSPGPAGDEALLDYDRLALPLVVRNRRPGDRLRPLGLGGTKKIKKLLIDAKVPRRHRDLLPVIVSGRDVVLVAGIAVDERFAANAQTRRILRIRVKPRQG